MGADTAASHPAHHTHQLPLPAAACLALQPGCHPAMARKPTPEKEPSVAYLSKQLPPHARERHGREPCALADQALHFDCRCTHTTTVQLCMLPRQASDPLPLCPKRPGPPTAQAFTTEACRICSHVEQGLLTGYSPTLRPHTLQRSLFKEAPKRTASTPSTQLHAHCLHTLRGVISRTQHASAHTTSQPIPPRTQQHDCTALHGVPRHYFKATQGGALLV
jgi:hypothetical protein